jgi:hypothetical protein
MIIIKRIRQSRRIEIISINVCKPQHLPDWTTTLVILLLPIVFPITAISSWIFDITLVGLKKTEPIKAAKEKETVSFVLRRPPSDSPYSTGIVSLPY